MKSRKQDLSIYKFAVSTGKFRLRCTVFQIVLNVLFHTGEVKQTGNTALGDRAYHHLFFFFNQTGTLSPERGLYIHKGKLFRNKIPLSQKLPTHVLKKKSTFFWFANIIKVPAYTKRKRLSRTFLSSAAFGLISATNTNFMPSFPCFC